MLPYLREKGPLLREFLCMRLNLSPQSRMPPLLLLYVLSGFHCVQLGEALSFYLIPQILSQSAWFIVLPLIGCVAFNLVHGEDRGMKYASIALTVIYLFLVFPYETGLYQELLHKDEVVLQTITPDSS